MRVGREGAVVAGVAVRAVRAQARLDAREALPVAVRDEVVGVAVRHVLVVLLHDLAVDVVDRRLEEVYLERRVHDGVRLG